MILYTRPEKRQEKLAQAEELRTKELEAKGFNLVGSGEYREKRAIANRKCSCETAEEEKLDRQISVEAALKVYRRTLPILLNRLSKIEDPRQPNKVKHSLTVLMIYGILMFVYQQSSLRNANKEMSTPIFFENMKAMFPDFETMPHADTLSRLLDAYRVRSFLAYLSLKGYVSETLCLAVTSVSAKRARVVRTLNVSQIQSIYHYRDSASTPAELRNIAIILLGLRAGLRASDISNLRLHDISWSDKTISISQKKTGKCLVLPFATDAGTPYGDTSATQDPYNQKPTSYLYRAKRLFRN